MQQHPLPIPGPLSLGDIIDRAFRLYRTHFGRLIGVLALVLVPWTIVLTAATYVAAANGSPGLALLGTLLNLADSLVTGLAGLALYFVITALLDNSPMSAAEAWRSAVGRFWSWFGMTLLMGLAAIGVVIPGAVIYAVVLGVFGDSESTGFAVMAIALVIGLMALPMLLLFTRWLVAQPALVAEGLGAGASLGRSWRLTSRLFWRCLGFALLIYLLGVLIMLWPVLLELAPLFGFVPPLWLSSAALPLLTAVLTILWLPLSSAAYMLFYYDLRVRTEGYDLAQRVDQLVAAAGQAEWYDAAAPADDGPVT